MQPRMQEESSDGGPAPISCARDVVNRKYRTDPQRMNGPSERVDLVTTLVRV